MDSSYQNNYHHSKINPHKLRSKVSAKYRNYNQDQEYNFDQMLFILDQECFNNKCDRDVARELFEQSATPENKASLNEFIFKYVQNLQTSKLCCIREETAVDKLERKIGELKGRSRSYVYLKIIQVTVHARFSQIPSFTYKIQPSDIPPVTVVNSLNPILNHEYTLQMETNQFRIAFYESGVKIGDWQWPDSQESEKEGEYHRNVVAENLSFELRIKYKPINSNSERKTLEKELYTRKSKRDVQRQAFHKLCTFQPFLQNNKPLEHQQRAESHLWAITESLIECMPFLASHVRNLYYMLILLVLIESLAAISWGMEFIDIALAFGTIAMLYDQGQYDLGMELWVSIMALILLCVKSVWGAVVKDNDGPHLIVFLVAAVLTKVGCIFFLWITAIRKAEVPLQRKFVFYDDVDPKAVAAEHQAEHESQNEDIWL